MPLTFDDVAKAIRRHHVISRHTFPDGFAVTQQDRDNIERTLPRHMAIYPCESGPMKINGVEIKVADIPRPYPSQLLFYDDGIVRAYDHLGFVDAWSRTDTENTAWLVQLTDKERAAINMRTF